MGYENTSLSQRHHRRPVERLFEASHSCLPRWTTQRKTNLRDVVNAIFYILRTGCQWRYLPKDFPPKSTVWRYFDEWRHNGTLDTIHDLLPQKVRAEEKPYAPRTTASVGQPVGRYQFPLAASSGGRDNAKNVDGRKRHIVVDSMGLLLAVLVTAADVDDAKAAAGVVRATGRPTDGQGRTDVRGQQVPQLRPLRRWVETNARWEMVIVRRPDGTKGWVKLPIRWTVERTFASAGQVSPPEQGPGEERPVVGGLRQIGHDPPHA